MNATQNNQKLAMLAHKTLFDSYLGAENGSDIFQVTRGWQREILLTQERLAIARTSMAFEDAMQAPGIQMVYVPGDAVLTQSIAIRILQRNPLSKIIYWEV